MIRIHVKFRRSRAKQSQKQGVVYFQIIDGFHTEDNPSVSVRAVNTDVKGDDASVIEENKEHIIKLLKQFYCLVEGMSDINPNFTVGDVAEKFKELLSGNRTDTIITDAIKKADTDFVWKNKLVNAPTLFRKDIRTDDAYFPIKRRHRNKTEDIISEVTDLTSYIKHLIQRLGKDGKYSLIGNYRACLNKIVDFKEEKPIPFNEVNRNFILAFGEYLKSDKEIQESTQSLYMRSLQTMLNHAQSDGYLVVKSEWFKGTNRKIHFGKEKPLTYEEAYGLLMRIAYAYLGNEPELEEIRDMFMFAFYCRGLEKSEVLCLTSGNIKDGYLIYNRRGIGKRYRVPLERQALEITEKYKPAEDAERKQLFPTSRKFADYMTSSAQTAISKRIRVLGEKIGYDKLTFGMNITLWRILFSQSTVISSLI